jgi:hypothetical protein
MFSQCFGGFGKTSRGDHYALISSHVSHNTNKGFNGCDISRIFVVLALDYDKNLIGTDLRSNTDVDLSISFRIDPGNRIVESNISSRCRNGFLDLKRFFLEALPFRFVRHTSGVTQIRPYRVS